MKFNPIQLKLKPFSLLWFLIALVISLIEVSFVSTHSFANSPNATIQFVQSDWIAQHTRDSRLRILDVRSNPLDYFKGHIPNAVHIAESTFRGPNGVLPVQYWNAEEIGNLFSQAGVTNKSQVLIYSDGRDVLGATMVAYLLERSGLKQIAILNGGFKAYQTSGQPISQEFPKYSISQFTVRDMTHVRVTLADVREAIKGATFNREVPLKFTFIDPRPPDIFQGKEKIWIRNGHIPGAKNLPWTLFTEGNAATNEGNFHQLKSLDEIRQLLSDRKISTLDNIVVTCSTGREATLQYVVLKHLLGYPNVRVYEGSWTEYSSHPDLPVETGPEKPA